MQYYNNILCERVEWLVESGIMSYTQYEYLAKRKRLDVVRRGCRDTPALVAYESLPDRYKAAIRLQLGCEPHEAVRKMSGIEARIEHNGAASEYFESYRLPDGRGLKPTTQREYYANAIVLEAVGRLLTDVTQMRRSRGGRVKHDWDAIAASVQELDRVKYPHALPANGRRLEDRFRQFLKEGYGCLIHRNFANRTAAKVDDEVKESYLIELISSPKNLDNAQVARLYNTIAEPLGWKKIGASTVASYRRKWELTAYAGRRGTSAFMNEKAMQVKRKAPSAPLLFWTVDGWDVELLYQQETGGRTTYHHRPTVVVVLDGCLKYPVGYAVGTHETPALTQAALRSAARHTAELFGTMYRAHQLQSDRYALKTLTASYATVAEKVTPARARNAKAKVIEPYFGMVNKRYCQLLPNWSGFGITSDRDRQPNGEYLNKIKGHFPDYAGVCRQVDEIIAAERAAKRERYLELWSGLTDDRKIELGRESYLLQFGETTGHTVLLQGSGLHPTIGGVRRSYDCFDIGFRDHAATKWVVHYDPEDLTRVLATDEGGELRYLLEAKHVQPMALADRQAGDSEALERVNRYNRALIEEVTERRARSGDLVSAHLRAHGHRIENETLKRLLITDSTGQHKNVKSRARLELPATDVECEEDRPGDVFSRY